LLTTSSNDDVAFVRFILCAGKLVHCMQGDNTDSDIKNRLAEKMAGEITLSNKPGDVMKKWRLNFDVAQSDLSTFLDVSPSVISDYESGPWSPHCTLFPRPRFLQFQVGIGCGVDRHPDG